MIERLRALRAALLPSNPFFAPRLRDDFATLEDFSARVPLLEKAELVADQLAHPPFGSNLTFPLDQYTRFCQTSGTTGSPLRWVDTPESWAWMARCWRRVFEAGGVTKDDRVFFAFSFGPFLGFWTAFDAATSLGCMAIPGGGMTSTARLRTLIDAKATVLCCTPTYAIRLGETARAENLSGASISKIFVAGEPGGSVPATRALLERLWPRAKIVDHHGMTETGPVSYECPHRPRVLHVIESEYFAEIVAPATGAPCAEGERGELVLTNLGRIGSPVIRYRTGDIVHPAPRARCVCGTEDLALVGGILARRDDMVVIRGVNVYPSAIEDILRTFEAIEEYRVEIATVRSMIEMRLRIEPDPGEEVRHRLDCALRDALGLRIPIECVPAGTLPRFEMKSKRWVHS